MRNVLQNTQVLLMKAGGNGSHCCYIGRHGSHLKTPELVKFDQDFPDFGQLMAAEVKKIFKQSTGRS